MNNNGNEEVTNLKKNSRENIVKAVFLTSLAGISVLASFSFTFGSTKKKDSLVTNSSIETYETGTRLAIRALKFGTIYAFSGFGIICFGIWKLSGAKNMQDFRNKIGSLFPQIPKQHPQGRCDFESVTDLLQYLDSEYSSDKSIQDVDERNC